MTADRALLGARVRRVDAPFAELLALTLSSPSLQGVLLLGVSVAARGIGWLDRRPPGRADSPLLQKLKSALEGGRIRAIERPSASLLRLQVERGEQQWVLEAVLRGSNGNLLLRDDSGTVLVALRPLDARDEQRDEPASARSTEPSRQGRQGILGGLDELEALRVTGARMLEACAGAAVEQRRLTYSRALRTAHRRLEHRLAAIEGDLARSGQADLLRHHASLLLSHLHQLPSSGSAVELLDYASDPPVPLTLAIDPALGPKRQAEAWFRKARRLERGAGIASERARLTREQLAALDAIMGDLAQAQDESELEQLATRARALQVPLAAVQQAGTKRVVPERLPYRRFAGSEDRAILVGRGAKDNDRLTLDHARPQDLWLHARDDAGAHVVVPLERGEACPPELLCDAATLAAHFSQARGQSRIDVVYAPRRYVHKTRKAEPGLMHVTREKVFRLELQPERLRRLLASERI
jgi:predicted ribosome quality control (RQC) complex YloA/Tae2 family protein